MQRRSNLIRRSGSSWVYRRIPRRGSGRCFASDCFASLTMTVLALQIYWRNLRDMTLASARIRSGHLPVGLYLRFKTIAVFIENKIHTAMFIAWFFKKTAFFLLFWIFSAADGHFFLFAVIGFRTTHLDCLLVQAIQYSTNRSLKYWRKHCCARILP